METRTLLPEDEPVAWVDAAHESSHPELHVVATRDHELIQCWAARHQAEPATGEATASGPSTQTVKDEGTGLRFNFPGVQRFRSIDWEEWFGNFDRFNLAFVYEREQGGASPSYRYRVVPLKRLQEIARLRS